MFSCLLAPLGYIIVGFLGALLFPKLGNVGVGLAIAVTVIGYLALFLGLARLGWRLGRRYLREYDQPVRPVWGEDDADPATEVAIPEDMGVSEPTSEAHGAL
jgi:hypothetical protein